MPTAAIYARKSKATDKGESIENQINRGQALCQLRGWDHVVYEDYDFSGKTLERPSFEQMMRDAKAGKFEYIVCYKLDRISRSVNDFSSLVDELNTLGIGFVCIKDNFDTSTPMGRAMMYITSVFAQLERETLAERVKDNMIDRAKMGKWNGGPVPYGFNLHKETINNNGRNKKISKLIINENESAKIKEFYKWYLESDGSVRNNVFRANSLEYSYKTKNGAQWSHNQMSRLLQNSLYCIADQDAYDYFKNNTDVQIINAKEDFNGAHGLMFYNRRKTHKKTSRQKPEEDWILVIGEHKGIIPGEMYRNVQNKLSINKSRAPRQGQSSTSPLVGLVRCARCNSAMSVFSSKSTKNGVQKYFRYFRCITKEQKSKILCDNNNVRADILEDLVVNHIGGLCANKKLLKELLENANKELDDKRLPLISNRNKIQSELDNNESETNNLVLALSKGTLPDLIIKKRYKELDEKKNILENRLQQIEFELNNNYEHSYDFSKVMEYLKTFNISYGYLTFEEKKKLLRSIIKEIRIDRDKVTLLLHFLPTQTYDSHAFCLRKDMDSY